MVSVSRCKVSEILAERQILKQKIQIQKRKYIKDFAFAISFLYLCLLL